AVLSAERVLEEQGVAIENLMLDGGDVERTRERQVGVARAPLADLGLELLAAREQLAHLAREQRGVFRRVLRLQHLRLPLGSTVDSILQRAFACAQLVADAAPDSPTRFAEPFEQTSGARALR